MSAITLSQTDFWQPTQGPYTGNIGEAYRTPTGKIFIGSCACSLMESAVYQSTDNGEDWQPASITTSKFATRFDGSIYTAKDGSLYTTAYGGMVYRSIDDGTSLNQLSSCAINRPVAFHIASSGIMAVAGWGGIGVSSNNGVSWRNTAPKQYRQYISFITITSNAKGYFIAADETDNWWISRNGRNWARRYVLRKYLGEHVVANSQGYFFLTTYTGKIVRSTDNGTHWAVIAVISGPGNQRTATLSILPSGDLLTGMADGRLIKFVAASNWQQQLLYTFPSSISGFVFNLTGDTMIVTTQSDGIYRSSDAGASWASVGLRLSEVWNFTRTYGSYVFALSQYSRQAIYRSSDNGVSWNPIERGLSISTVFGGTSTGTLFLEGCCDFGVSRSTDNGSSWAILTDTVLPKGGINSFYEITNGNVLATSLTGIFRTGDNGTTWNKVFDTPSGTVFQGRDGTIFASGNGMLRSTDNGSTWTQINNGLTDLGVRSFTQASDSRLYATTGTGIFSSVDNGNSWSLLTSSPPRNDLATIIADAHDNIFINTGSTPGSYNSSAAGVFTSTDRGASWTQINIGLPFLDVISMTIASDGHLLLGGERFGIFRGGTTEAAAHLQPMSKQNLPKEFSLYQNYPDPFNPTTEIGFDLTTDAVVTLKVYNTLGQVVATLADKNEFNAGTNELGYDGSNLPSGAYYYRIVAQDAKTGHVQYTNVKKMMLVK